MDTDKSPNTSKQEGPAGLISVILADDHPVVIQSLKNELSRETDFKVVGEASDGEQAVELVLKLTPRVVLMDIGMPKLNGIEATKIIKSRLPDTIVLVLTVYDDIEHILGILESGADGYLTKNIPVERIVDSMRLAVTGETVLSPQIFKQVLKYALRYITKPLVISNGTRLTPREQEILKLVARGLSNKEIADQINLGSRTVKSHLVDIFSKLKVNSRTEAVIIGMRAGFIKLNDLEY
jgi:two-component system, NarL family, response regulator LiaR